MNITKTYNAETGTLTISNYQYNLYLKDSYGQAYRQATATASFKVYYINKLTEIPYN